MCGFDGTQLTSELKEILREVRPAGLILFSRNIESAEQVAEFNAELKAFRPDEPLSLSVDQEGGRVARLKSPLIEWPPMREIGALKDPKLLQKIAYVMGSELRALNFDIDFAPVLDVDTNPDNPVIGDRAFSSDPAEVATLGSAFIKGLEYSSVGACGKHFPGHGDTHLDSHLALPHIEHEIPRLREIEWHPFREAIKAGLSAIMTAHVVVEAIDDVPATLSPKAMNYLRGELEFGGVIISDDLEMKALYDHFSVEEMARKALAADVDIFLACHKAEVIFDLYRAMIVGVEEKSIDAQRLVEASERSVEWRSRFYKPATEPAGQKEALASLGNWEHQAVKEELEKKLRQG
ncbi:beta-N-acetylhexosaminidase [Myxococcota bacterium]|nr:beta-N-acetylhexosaminidase [Myxococcota bacterium]